MDSPLTSAFIKRFSAQDEPVCCSKCDASAVGLFAIENHPFVLCEDHANEALRWCVKLKIVTWLTPRHKRLQ
jgi:hypothetical protein